MSTYSSTTVAQRGFTIVELSIILVLTAILFGIGFDFSIGYQTRARDSERSADAYMITQSLERYYRTQAVSTGATYPPTSIGASGLTTYIGSDDIVRAPGKTSTSIVIASNANPQTPTKDQYIYQPLNLDGTRCTSAPCVRYKVYYRRESNNEVITLESLRQQ